MKQAQQQSLRLLGSRKAYADRQCRVLDAFTQLTKASLDYFPQRRKNTFQETKRKEPGSTILSFAK